MSSLSCVRSRNWERNRHKSRPHKGRGYRQRQVRGAYNHLSVGNHPGRSPWGYISGVASIRSEEKRCVTQTIWHGGCDGCYKNTQGGTPLCWVRPVSLSSFWKIYFSITPTVLKSSGNRYLILIPLPQRNINGEHQSPGMTIAEDFVNSLMTNMFINNGHGLIDKEWAW
jgi:hypothetical protein